MEYLDAVSRTAFMTAFFLRYSRSDDARPRIDPGRAHRSVGIGGVCVAPPLTSGDDQSLCALSEGDGETEFADADLFVEAVPERFAVPRGITSWRVDDLVELVDDPIQLVG